MTRISVVIPARNAEATLGAAIKSVLAQEHLPDEVIVVDNGSSDGTRMLASSFGGRVRCVSPSPPYGGPSSSRNFGIQSATGEWISFLDADDEWLPNRLSKQLEILKNNPCIAWLAGDYESVVPHRKPKQLGLSRFMDRQTAVVEDALILMSGPKRWSGDAIWTGTVLARMDAIDTVTDGQNWFDPDQTTSHDLDLWLRLAARFPRLGYVREPIARYIQLQDGSMTSRDAGSCDMSSLALIDRGTSLANQLVPERRTAVMQILSNLASLLCRNAISVGNFKYAKRLIFEYNKRGIRLPLLIRLAGLSPDKLVELSLQTRRQSVRLWSSCRN